MTELLLILASLAILAVIFLPALVKSRARTSKLGCANCLKQVGLAFRTWAIDNDDHFPMQVSVTNGGTLELTGSGLVFPHFQVVSNELSTPTILWCPNDESRTYPTNFTGGLTDKNISYFLNVDAVPEDGSSLLCGDRNLTNQPSGKAGFVTLSNGTRIGWTREIHSRSGYIAFGDGRVEGNRNGNPHTVIHLPEGATNCLAMP
ncbi:MAG TPA: type II secretion system protein [Verrucomicrobiota bacterium]|jgi:type II secretory pathway pseudopilin PulG|nr:type II secretion system protein [Verrucomicrobiota bacterium]HQL77756.1 type II secretion system protein [Verrucomicrobiota bacterium]